MPINSKGIIAKVPNRIPSFNNADISVLDFISQNLDIDREKEGKITGY